MRSFLATLKWRMRTKKFFTQRLLHLLDNQPGLAVLVKGRSSSKQLRRVTSKINMLLLASFRAQMYSYTETDKNPADARSRKTAAGGARLDDG